MYDVIPVISVYAHVLMVDVPLSTMFGVVDVYCKEECPEVGC